MRRPSSLDIDDWDRNDENCVSLTWSVDADGNMRHKPTKMCVSVDRGIAFEGREYRLSPDDIELSGPVLGGGAGGVVQLGAIKGSGTQVAIKTIRMDDREKRRQLLNEIRSLVQAEGCPYLVQWYAGFVSQKIHAVHVILEYLDLGSLGNLRMKLGSHGVPAQHLSCIAMQATAGLVHLHSLRVLHRDVKPQNVLLNSLGEVKLTDFGIAKVMEPTVQAACSVVGTQTYMSPERVKGGYYSFNSDVWSLGMVVYEMAAGRYPFPEVTSFIVLFDYLCQRPEPRLDDAVFPEALCCFVALCLSRDPAERSGSENLAAHEFAVAGQGLQEEFAMWLATVF